MNLISLDPISDASTLFSALDHYSVWEYLAGRPDNPKHLSKILLAQRAQPNWQQWLAVGHGVVLRAQHVAGVGVKFGSPFGQVGQIRIFPLDKVTVSSTPWLRWHLLSVRNNKRVT